MEIELYKVLPSHWKRHFKSREQKYGVSTGMSRFLCIWELWQYWGRVGQVNCNEQPHYYRLFFSEGRMSSTGQPCSFKPSFSLIYFVGPKPGTHMNLSLSIISLITSPSRRYLYTKRTLTVPDFQGRSKQ